VNVDAVMAFLIQHVVIPAAIGAAVPILLWALAFVEVWFLWNYGFPAVGWVWCRFRSLRRWLRRKLS
jgi:hypothetical protein